MADLLHPSFKQPPDPNVQLWRYMDLSKFVSLLQKRALVFPRADKLGDPFEGSVPVPNAIAYEAVLEVRKHRPHWDEDPLKGFPDDQVRQIAKMKSESNKKSVQRAFVSCWHMNDAESAAMWKLYSNSSDAICIRTTYADLASVLPSEVCMGIVEYINFSTTPIVPGNMFNAFLVKRKSFSHEQEARGIVLDFSGVPGPPVLELKEYLVDLSKLVHGVLVSPEAPDWFKDVVQGICDQYDLKVSVQHSEMNATPLY